MVNAHFSTHDKTLFQQELTTQLMCSIVVLNSQLEIQYVNPAAESLLLRSYNKLINTAFHDVFFNDSINDQRLLELLSTGQKFTDNEVFLRLSTRDPITVEITVSSIEIKHIPFILLELKHVDQLKQISAEAFQQHQWEAARDLIKGLAHEIKNPLGGLRGAAQLLARELSSDQQEYTTMIIEQADRLTNLVDRLLGPNQLPKFSDQNIHHVLETICQLIQFDNPKNLKIIRDYDPSIPEIKCDAHKLQQAILNIANNAAQILNNKGQIKFKTRIATNQSINGKLVKLAVKIAIIDNGPGIPLKIQDTLFYPMVSGKDNGTGLGLSISQTLINQHHGKLSCNSYPGHTEFIILLPILKSSHT